jgi:hypothetical protein
MQSLSKLDINHASVASASAKARYALGDRLASRLQVIEAYVDPKTKEIYLIYTEVDVLDALRIVLVWDPRVERVTVRERLRP